ncbi:unnamed protein product [Prunus armeniaca]
MSDIDYALTYDEPTRTAVNSTVEVKRVHEAWRMANKKCLLEIESAKQFMESIERKFKESDNAETKNLISRRKKYQEKA